MTAMRWRTSTPLSGLSGIPATMAEPEVGAINVPRVRTVVVLPAPLGPRKPNTSPRNTSKETSEKAVRRPKRLVGLSTVRTGSAPESEGGLDGRRSDDKGLAGVATVSGRIAGAV